MKHITIKDIRVHTGQIISEMVDKYDNVYPILLMCYTGPTVTAWASQEILNSAALEQFEQDFRLLCLAESATATARITKGVFSMNYKTSGEDRLASNHSLRNSILVSIELQNGKRELNLYPVCNDHGKLKLGNCQICEPKSRRTVLPTFLPKTLPTEGERAMAANFLAYKERLREQHTHQDN